MIADCLSGTECVTDGARGRDREAEELRRQLRELQIKVEALTRTLGVVANMARMSKGSFDRALAASEDATRREASSKPCPG